MTTQSMETTIEWTEYIKKRGIKKGKLIYYTYENNIASDPKTRHL